MATYSTERDQIRHRPFGDFDAQLEQFTVDSWRSLVRIRLCHFAYKIADFRAGRRPAGPSGMRLKSPEQLKSLSVPSHHGIGLHDDQSITPVAPDGGKQDPEETVTTANLRPLYRLFHDGQLLA